MPQETHWKYLSFLGVQAEQYRILACKNALWKASGKKKRSIKHRKWKGNPPKPCGQLRSRRFAHAIWKALFQAQLMICWSNTHVSEVLLLSWAWERPHCPSLGMLGGKAGLFGPSQGSPLPGAQVSSHFILSDAQNAGHRGFAKMRPDILQTPSNRTWTEQLTLAISQYLSLAELLLPWWHMVLHRTEAFQTHPHLQFPWDRWFSTRTDFFNLLPWISGNVCGH